VSARLDPLAFAERVLAVLESEGSFTSTYKYAVLLGLMDLCLEGATEQSLVPTSVTTDQLARKVIELYWPQSRAWDERGALSQARSQKTDQAVILQELGRFRVDLHSGKHASLASLVRRQPGRFESLVNAVEETLVYWPISRLQVVGRGRLAAEDRFVYEYGWNKGEPPTRRAFREYQRLKPGGARPKKPGEFVNVLTFQEGVPEAFIALNGLLRPVIHREWARKVASLNQTRTTEGRLEQFLFAADRASLQPVRAHLVRLSVGRCFYCQDSLKVEVAHVDHFIPWARHPDNGLSNLVAAHGACNESKSASLASTDHVVRWAERNLNRAGELSAISNEIGWELDTRRPASVATGIYGRLPERALLWHSPGRFMTPDTSRIIEALRPLLR